MGKIAGKKKVATKRRGPNGRFVPEPSGISEAGELRTDEGGVDLDVLNAWRKAAAVPLHVTAGMCEPVVEVLSTRKRIDRLVGGLQQVRGQLRAVLSELDGKSRQEYSSSALKKVGLNESLDGVFVQLAEAQVLADSVLDYLRNL